MSLTRGLLGDSEKEPGRIAVRGETLDVGSAIPEFILEILSNPLAGAQATK